MTGKRDEETSEKITVALTAGRWTHDHPITIEEAGNLVLAVTAGLPEEVYQLMELFPQAMQRRTSVQHIPKAKSGEEAG